MTRFFQLEETFISRDPTKIFSSPHLLLLRQHHQQQQQHHEEYGTTEEEQEDWIRTNLNSTKDLLPLLTESLELLETRSTFDFCRAELTTVSTFAVSSQYCRRHHADSSASSSPTDFQSTIITTTTSDHFHHTFDLIFHQLGADVIQFIQNSTLLEKEEKIDSYRVFAIPNVFCQGHDQIFKNDITLTTQLGLNKIARLSILAARWNGPVSAVVRLTSLEDLHQLKESLWDHRENLKKVAFHLYFEHKDRTYPINILRNMAINEIKSDYFALFDVDFFPSPINTHAHLKTLFQNNKILQEKMDHNRTMFVMPAWESDEIVEDQDLAVYNPLVYPESREMLTNTLQTSSERRRWHIFHDRVPEAHRCTNYPKWLSMSTLDSEVSYPIQNNEFGYEPYVLGSVKGIPRFFPDFRGYGFNKHSFFAELHYAKYNFEVLRDVFVFHVNHPKSYGGDGEKSRQVNLVCVKFFLDHLARTYGAGYLRDDEEFQGYHTFVSRMRPN